MIDHGFTPGNKFTPDRCRVTLARYPCPHSREEHDPTLPPEDVDAFGYRRRARDIPVKIFRFDVTPECEHIATVTAPLHVTHGQNVYTTDPVTICVTCNARVDLAPATEGA